MKVYVAHPISGYNTEEVYNYYDTISTILRPAEVLSPMMGKDSLRCDKQFKAEGYKDNPLTTNHAIMERDMWMVSQSDIVFVNFIRSNSISIGCCMELAVAHWLRKYTVVVLPKENIHRHAFILEAADVIFEDEDEAIQYIKNLIYSIKGSSTV